MISFFFFLNVLFCSFLFQNVRGAVIVCVIYTTGYKTPLCHSPESTYRCCCTVYQHMYCSKISFACMAPGWSLETGRKSLLFGLSRNVKTKGLQDPRRVRWTSSSFKSCHPLGSSAGHRWPFTLNFGSCSSSKIYLVGKQPLPARAPPLFGVVFSCNASYRCCVENVLATQTQAM